MFLLLSSLDTSAVFFVLALALFCIPLIIHGIQKAEEDHQEKQKLLDELKQISNRSKHNR